MSFGHRERRVVRCAVEYLWEVSSSGSRSKRHKFGLLEKEVACVSVWKLCVLNISPASTYEVKSIVWLSKIHHSSQPNHNNLDIKIYFLKHLVERRTTTTSHDLITVSPSI